MSVLIDIAIWILTAILLVGVIAGVVIATAQLRYAQGDDMSETARCATCGASLDTPALAFLHDHVHGDSAVPEEYMWIPVVLYPTIAALMEEYANERGTESRP